MPEKLNDPWLIAFVVGTMLLSLATCIALMIVRTHGPLLSFWPRRLVPWNAFGAVLACLLVLQVLVTALSNFTSTAPAAAKLAAEQEFEERKPETAPAEASASPATLLSDLMIQQVIIVGGVLAFIAIYFGATRCDLGLPTSRRELAHDVFVGCVAGIAALLPTRIIQGVLLYWMGKPETESGHQLIKVLMVNAPSVGTMLLATMATVVVAPICEEIVFRLLLQGWLEKWETERVFASAPVSQVTDEASLLESDAPRDPRNTTIDYPLPTKFRGWPYGWLPILASSLLFALAHFGYGPEPVPLFFLALVLGYLYQRTHRIVPCIVAHAVFNLFTMVVLWRLVFQNAE